MKKIFVTAATMAMLSGSALAAGKSGDKVYQEVCSVCHMNAIAGAPKFGDKAAWKDRVAEGKEKLYEHALKGYQGKAGFMPAKGGRADLSDDEVKAGVDFMVSKVK